VEEAKEEYGSMFTNSTQKRVLDMIEDRQNMLKDKPDVAKSLHIDLNAIRKFDLNLDAKGDSNYEMVNNKI
jgi:antirestriction protein